MCEPAGARAAAGRAIARVGGDSWAGGSGGAGGVRAGPGLEGGGGRQRGRRVGEACETSARLVVFKRSIRFQGRQDEGTEARAQAPAQVQAGGRRPVAAAAGGRRRAKAARCRQRRPAAFAAARGPWRTGDRVLDVIVARQAACLSSAAIELVHTASFVPIFNSGLYGRACFYPATQKRKGALIFWWGPWTQIMVLHNHRWPKNRHRNKGGYHVCPLPT